MVVKINLIYMITNNSTIKTSHTLSGSVPSSLMLGLITMHSWYLAHNADKSTDNVIKDLKTQLQGSLCLNQNKVQVGTECLEFKASCAEAQDFSVPEVHGTVCYASSDIQESSVLGSIIDVWNLLKNELSSFTSEELCCISNAVGFFIVFWLCGSLDYATIANLAPHLNEGVLSLIALCFIFGAIAKSSQIGLHAWLPSAMEGKI